MNHGQMIKSARKKLSLNQSDLADNKISRTLISEIEKGNTNLVTSKALLIYKKLIEEAYIQNIDVTLNFDKVLQNNIEYIQLKQARDILNTLNKASKRNEVLSEFILEEYRFFAQKSEIGLFKYYMFRDIASNVRENNSFKMKVLLNALEYLKWLSFEEVHEAYDETLKEVTPLAYKERLFERLIYYYEFQKNQLIEMKAFVEPRVYYNLSLLNEFLGNYEISYRYLNTYLDYKSTLELEDYYDALLAIARLATKSEDYKKGVKQYEEILLMIQEGTFVKQQSIALSNILFNIPKLEISYSKEKIKVYLDTLENLLPIILENRDFPSELLINMSIGYSLINVTKKSKEYLKKAFGQAETSELKANVIVDAFNAIEKLDIDLLVKNIIRIEFSQLRDKENFLIVLLKIQQKLCADNRKNLLQLLKEYINKI